MTVTETAPLPIKRPRESVPALDLFRHDMLAANARPELLRLVPVLRSIDEQFAANYRVYKGPDGVVIPVTHVSSTQLMTDTFGTPPPQADKKMIQTYYPGFGKTVEDGIKQAIPQLLQQIADRDHTLPPTDFYFFGYPDNLGGKFTNKFIHNLNDQGWPYYGEIYADIIMDIFDQNPSINYIQQPNGHSKGTYVGSYAHNALKERLHERGDLHVDLASPVWLNPPGSLDKNGHRRIGFDGIKLAGGWGIEKLAKTLADMIDGTSISALDKRFLADLTPILQAKGIAIATDNPTRELMKTEIRLLLERPELPDTGFEPVIEQGIFDLPNLSLKDIYHYLRGEREEEIIRGNGVTRRKLHMGIHSPRSFSDEVIKLAIKTAEGMSDESIARVHPAIARRIQRAARAREREQLLNW